MLDDSTCSVGTDGVVSLDVNEGCDSRAVCLTDSTIVDCPTCAVDMCLSSSVVFANRRPHFVQSAALAVGKIVKANFEEETSIGAFNYNPSSKE